MTAPAPTAPVRPPARRVLVVGDLVLDVVLVAATQVVSGTDVPGRVEIRQGGSAANTARWLARLGVRSQLVCSIGRDGAGRSLVAQLERDGVTVRATRVAGQRTGRIGVLVAPGGERSFIADRRAADRLSPDDLKPEWFRDVELVHLPAYSLLGEPLGRAGTRAVELARSARALVSLDLASIAPLMARGRRAARDLVLGVRPDLLFATDTECEIFLGGQPAETLLEYASVAVVKRGARGARVFAREEGERLPEPEPAAPADERDLPPPLRFDVATTAVAVTDTTGAGDAFDAGFIAGWLTSLAAGHRRAAALHRATVAAHRAAARHLRTPRSELPPG